MKYRLRLWLAVAYLTVAMTSIVGTASYLITRSTVIGELRARVGNMVDLGSLTVDQSSVALLADQISPDLPDPTREQIESSAAFMAVSDALNRVRETQPDLILYAYTLVPTSDPSIARFLVDADVAELVASGADDEEISHFNQEYDIADFPAMQEAFAGKLAVETSFSYDEDYDTNSFSGYAPIFSRGSDRVVAILGLDVSDREVAAHLSSLVRWILIFLIVSAAAAIGTAWLIANGLTAPLGIFFALFSKAASGDLAVRYPDRGGTDEIAETSRAFNHLMTSVGDSVTAIGYTAKQLSEESDLMAETASEIAAGSEEQSAVIGSVKETVGGFLHAVGSVGEAVARHRGAMNETVTEIDALTLGVDQVSKRAHEARIAATRQSEVARSGRARLRTAVEASESVAASLGELSHHFEDVKTKSDKIESAVEHIIDMSQRINVLAINAAIEAARLGSAGTGFKVVAGEVKTVANSMASYTGEISELISAVQLSVERTAASMGESVANFQTARRSSLDADEALETVSGAVSTIDGLVEEIEQSAERQGESAGRLRSRVAALESAVETLESTTRGQSEQSAEILAAMAEVDSAAASNASIAARVQSLSTTLAARSGELGRLLERFTMEDVRP